MTPLEKRLTALEAIYKETALPDPMVEEIRAKLGERSRRLYEAAMGGDEAGLGKLNRWFAFVEQRGSCSAQFQD